MKELNPKLTDDTIDKNKRNYEPFSWSVGFAPADDPEIAVVCMIPQGEQGSYSMIPLREVMGAYFGLLDNNKTQNNSKTEDKNKEEDNKKSKNEDINFASKMKK